MGAMLDIQHLTKRFGNFAAVEDVTFYSRALANVLFASEFNRRFSGSSHLRAFAADPGLVKTEIGFKSKWAWGVRRRGGIQPERAAEGIVFLASEPSIQTSEEVYWKDCKPKTPSPYARNPQVARQLWDLSAQMCGL